MSTSVPAADEEKSAVADRPANALPDRPLVIAHRGASGRRPEHTLAAYELALAEGADFIELDLVATRDGALVVRHENALAVVALDDAGQVIVDEAGRPEVVEATTDVAERAEFADRLTVKSVDGRPVGGWFSEDFTLAEIRRLRARERMPSVRPWNRLYDDAYSVPTLADVIDLVRDSTLFRDTSPGLYIELKHPTYFAREGRRLDGSTIGLDLGRALLAELTRSAFLDPDRVFIQCFEVAPLIELKDELDQRGIAIPLIQLFGDVENRHFRAAPRDVIDRVRRNDTAVYGALASRVAGGLREDITYAELATPSVLEFLHQRYAAGIGPPRQNVLTAAPDGAEDAGTVTGAAAPLLVHARQAGLLVHPYTLRAEAPFLLRRDGRLMPVDEEARVLLEAGVNGFFIDQPDEGRLAVDRFLTGVERAGSL